MQGYQLTSEEIKVAQELIRKYDQLSDSKCQTFKRERISHLRKLIEKSGKCSGA